jgi:hypothetical protein
MNWRSGFASDYSPLLAALFRETGLARVKLNGGNTASFSDFDAGSRQAQP